MKETLFGGMMQQEKGTEQRSLLGLLCLQSKYMFWDQSVNVTPPQQPNCFGKDGSQFKTCQVSV